MSRAHARLCVIAVVAVTLVLAGAPRADARPLNAKPTTGVVTADWLHAATAWFGGLLNRLAGQVPTGKKAPEAPTPTATTAPLVIGGGGGGYRPNTGSCIDPLGGRVPCTY